MSIIRVRKVADGEELVLAEELWEARLELGQLDPRAESLERRHKALTDPQPGVGRREGGGPARPRLRAKTHDWGF